jgi:hypothetical protein
MLFDPEQKEFYAYVQDKDDPEGNLMPGVSAIAQDPSGSIWVATWSFGIYKISPPFMRNGNYIYGTTKSYKYEVGLPEELNEWGIRSLLVPDDNSKIELWIGTDAGGLFKLAQNSDQKEFLINYSTKDGLPDQSINGIEEDAYGYLWLSTGNGLSRFDPETETFINYTIEDGLPGNLFGWLSHYRDPGGKLYYNIEGQGLISFYPDSLNINQYVPPVYITGISVYNDQLEINEDSPLRAALSETDEVVFSYEQNYITLKYAALNFIKSH